MPLYEYQCEHCGVRFERLRRKRDADIEECPECGGQVRRLIQPPRIIFKGSGFYVTDNRRSSAGSRRSRDSQASEDKGDSGEKTQKKSEGDQD
jgi:putative FmdB family regulatory protein